LGVGREAKEPTPENLVLRNHGGGQDPHGVVAPVEKKRTIPSRSLPRMPLLLWNMKVHYHIHKISSLNPTLSQLNPVYVLIRYFSSIQHNIILPSIFGSCSFLLHSDLFPYKFFYSFLTSPMRIIQKGKGVPLLSYTPYHKEVPLCGNFTTLLVASLDNVGWWDD
jgi:hypothetical protein